MNNHPTRRQRLGMLVQAINLVLTAIALWAGINIAVRGAQMPVGSMSDVVALLNVALVADTLLETWRVFRALRQTAEVNYRRAYVAGLLAGASLLLNLLALISVNAPLGLNAQLVGTIVVVNRGLDLLIELVETIVRK